MVGVFVCCPSLPAKNKDARKGRASKGNNQSHSQTNPKRGQDPHPGPGNIASQLEHHKHHCQKKQEGGRGIPRYGAGLQ